MAYSLEHLDSSSLVTVGIIALMLGIITRRFWLEIAGVVLVFTHSAWLTGSLDAQWLRDARIDSVLSQAAPWLIVVGLLMGRRARPRRLLAFLVFFFWPGLALLVVPETRPFVREALDAVGLAHLTLADLQQYLVSGSVVFAVCCVFSVMGRLLSRRAPPARPSAASPVPVSQPAAASARASREYAYKHRVEQHDAEH